MKVEIKIDQSTITNPDWNDQTRRATVRMMPNHHYLFKDGTIAHTSYAGDVFDPRFDCRSLREAIGLMKKYYTKVKKLSHDRTWVVFEAERKP